MVCTGSRPDLPRSAVISRVRNRPGALAHPAIEDQLYLGGPPDVHVLADDLLEEDTPGHRPVQHLRERELSAKSETEPMRSATANSINP